LSTDAFPDPLMPVMSTSSGDGCAPWDDGFSPRFAPFRFESVDFPGVIDWIVASKARLRLRLRLLTEIPPRAFERDRNCPEIPIVPGLRGR